MAVGDLLHVQGSPVIQLKVDQAKSLFLDRPEVIDAVNRAELAGLRRGGAIIRSEAQKLIRSPRSKKQRTKAKPPGNPPISRVGTLRKLIFFAWDRATRSVVVGPVLSNSPTGAPERLEHGGVVFKPRKTKPPRRMVYRGHPYMKPGLAKALPDLPKQFRDTFK